VRCVSLFSGIGGIDLGFEQAGWTCTAQVEIDKAAQAVLRSHWPTTPLFDDVRDVHASDVGGCELIVAGSPCQGVSKAGGRLGLADLRSGLFVHFARLLDECRPGWFFFENVPGILNSPKSDPGADFDTVVSTLVDLGYGIAWRAINGGIGFGVPQQRRRLVVVGAAGGRRDRAARVLALDEVGGRDPRADLQGRGIDGPSAGGRAADDGRVIFRKARRAQTVNDRETWVPEPWSNCLTLFDIGDVRATQLVLEPDGRLRRLCAEEHERLFGFPTGWTDVETKPGKRLAMSKRQRMLANAVVVPMARWVGERIAHEMATCTTGGT
jgi:DNA (cytosine-5)-methyltransferase 1